MRNFVLLLSLLFSLVATLPAETFLVGLRLAPDRQAALASLLARQQDPASPDYRRWLSPAEFRTRFAPPAEARAQLRSRLLAGGFQLRREANSGLWFEVEGDPSLLSRSSFPEVLHLGHQPAQLFQAPLPRSGDGGRAIVPEDIAVIYNLTSVLRAGNNGHGLRIVIPGQVDLDVADINLYRSRFNLPALKLTKVAASPTPPPANDRAAAEANLNLQLAGAVAREAELVYVYAADIRSAFFYAIDQNLGHILSASFGECEAAALNSAQLYRTMVQQATAQGMTVVAASGNTGPAGCDAALPSATAVNAPSAVLPASVPEATAVGGTTLTPQDGPYWRPAPDFNGVSAISYVPELAWSDSTATGLLAAGGGGPSRVFPRPAWQDGPGVPGTNFRGTPDLAFAASRFHNGYAYVHQGAWTMGGGTSAATPVFAGMLAVLQSYLLRNNQIARPGLGNINPALYRMWQTIPAAFHDITTGSNQVPCAPGTPECVAGRFGANATPGYDYATGLGSLDGNLFVTRWDPSATVGTVLTLTPAATSVNFNASLELSVIVRSVGTFNPSGPITFLNAATGRTLSTVNLISGGSTATAIYNMPAHLLSPGANRIIATYPGNAQLNGSAAEVAINVTLPAQNSAVALEVEPREISESAPDNTGARWFLDLTLRELAGTLTNVTSLTVGEQDLSNQIRSLFGGITLQARGTLSARLALNNLTPLTPLRIFVSGSDSGNFRWNREIFVPIYGRRQVSLLSRGGLVNAASFAEGVAPGSITSLFGFTLANGTGQAEVLPLPNSLAGATATVNGLFAPLYFASSGQLNLQIPYEATPGPAVLRLTVDFPNGQRETLSHGFFLSPTAPGIFAAADGSLVPFASGARGATLLAFLTGDGALAPALPTGRGPDPATPLSQLPRPVADVRLTIGGVEAPIAFIGVPPGLAGATQINFVIPANAPLGPQDLLVRVGSTTSKPVKLTVLP
ncbi:MAG: protease pro-enzyme activation domain-containing protein [Bryobacter sp.]|nr:protease pro-enzyme activation domain-containing protein [Bryobacter sp.]